MIKTGLIFLIILSPIFSQSIKFNHLTVKDGLSNNRVNAIIQDQTGFIWFGTEDGLNRFDGYNLKIFRNDAEDSTSISDNTIWALSVDTNGDLWIGTKDGFINKYNPISEKFTKWKIKSERTNQNSVTAIHEDKKGNIWIATRRDGVYKFNPALEKFSHWNKDTTNENYLSHNTIRTINEDAEGNILIGTYIGLNKLFIETPSKGIIKYFCDKLNQNTIYDNQIYNISKSKLDSNIFWIGGPSGLTKFNSPKNSFKRFRIPNPDNLLFGSGASSVIEEEVNGDKIIWTDTYNGLVHLNLRSNSSIRFIHNENDPNSLVDNQINRIFKDRAGVLWIATNNGISYYSEKISKFNSLLNPIIRNFLKASKNKKDLKAILKDKSDQVWMGFKNGIISAKDNYDNSSFRNFQKLSNLNVWSLAKDLNNSLWIGTFGQGLKVYDPLLNQLKSWSSGDNNFNSSAALFNKSLLKDSNGNIWIGFWGLGVVRLEPATNQYNQWFKIPNDSTSLNVDDAWVIKEDQLGRIWIGTSGGGLSLFEDKNGGIFHHWLRSGNDKQHISSNNIFSIHEAKNLKNFNDLETTLWIGTTKGLNRFEIKNNKVDSDIYDVDVKINSFTIKDGLPDNSVNSIIEDGEGNLWLGTNSGISFFNVNKKTFTNFSTEDGINGTSMNPESVSRLDNGLILFGSSKGLNIFDPKKIKISSYKPNLVLTDFKIFNKSIKIGNNSPLKESISTTKEIELSYNQNVFSFEFAALDYNSSQTINYAYMMEGFDKDWIRSGTRRFATYTNLNPGKYKFKVKSTNADRVWNDSPISINIIVSPPWWKTWWAYLMYITLILFGLYLIRRFELNRTQLRNDLALSEFEVRKKSELEELKSRFFANLSHEFRTPLMLIKGPLEQLKKGREHNFAESVGLIEKNSARLKDLIDQLLELSKLEKAEIPIKAKPENVTTLLKGLTSSFKSLAEQKNIDLKFESDSEIKNCRIDRDKFEKIINNLLSNAIKFTPINGKISVIVKEAFKNEKPAAEVTISNSGTGIPKDKLENIFNRFYQVDDSTTRSYGGSGIGLALVKELVDLHRWEISVTSEPGTDTNFKLLIPICDEQLNENEKTELESVNKASPEGVEKDKNIISTSEILELSNLDNGGKPIVLVVDDSEDVRKYLKDLLIDNFKILEAGNGDEGIKVAAETIPDLIISDVMMPSMDGIEFCSKLKSDWQTSDIPVILLTAKASFEDKLEGLEIGADDYLTKPFDSRELFTRIKNLLEQRKRLRDKFSKNLNVFSETETLDTADDEFIKRTLELINDNIDKTNFGTEQLAKELFVSRTKLHRKIIAITGESPGVFVRTAKLKRAAKLLLEDKLSVTQIAFEIGFSSPAQFTRAFSKQFNSLPSEFSSKYKR